MTPELKLANLNHPYRFLIHNISKNVSSGHRFINVHERNILLIGGVNIKKCILFFISLFVCIFAFVVLANSESSEADTSDYSGPCGDEAFYEFDPDTGVLTVTGNGAIWDYTLYRSPWSSFSNFKTLKVEGTVTTIGSMAFGSCSQLEVVELSDSIVQLDDAAFWKCPKLTTVNLSKNITSLGASTFRECTSLQSIIIPNTVDTIPFSTFFACSSLTSVTLPDSVKAIEQNAFGKCTSLKTIDLKSVTRIGIWAFQTCSSLTDITISDSLTLIKEHSFYNCSSLTSVHIGNSVSTIEKSSFEGCTSLTTVNIPDFVESIGEYAFRGCTSLKSFEVGANNINYSSIDGVLFNKDHTKLIQYPACNTIDTYTIPDTVKSVSDYAFEGCSTLTTLIIPDTVPSFGVAVFNGCSNLHNLTIPADFDSVSSNEIPLFEGCVNIEKMSFTGTGSWFSYGTDSSSSSYYGNTPWQLSKSALTTVSISFGVQSIGSYAFSGCVKLATLSIPASVVAIQSNAFADCTSLSTLKIPDSVESIEAYAFTGCIGLTELAVPASLDCVVSNEKPIFNGCKYITSVTFTGTGDWYSYSSSTSEPSYYGYTPWQLTKVDYSVTISSGVQSIGNFAFMTCTNLKSISIPDSVGTIGSSAFQGCKSVTEISIPDSVTSIGSSAFRNCTSLTTMDLRSASNLGVSAFEGCVNLTSITLSSIKNLGSSAFRNCSNLSSADLSSVISIGERAFQGCVELVSANIGHSITTIGNGAFANCNLLNFDTLPGSVTSIGSSAFQNCVSILDITIPDSVNNIGSSAFQGCKSLNSVTLGNSITSIESDTFYDCSSLTSITFSTTLSSIGASAFYGCKNLSDLNFPGSLDSIGVSAFHGCTSLNSVNLPDSVTTLGNYCFYNCTNLRSIDLGSVTSVGDYVFSGCTRLSSVDFGSGASTIGNYAFYECSNLKSIVLTSVISLGDASFKDCVGLKEISIPAYLDCVKSADLPIFSGCTQITSVTFTGSGSWYQYGDLYEYTPWQLSKSELTSVTISDGVTTIGDYAFSGCTNLLTVTIGKSLVSIGTSVFSGCSSLISFQVNGNSKYCSFEGVLFDLDNASLIKYPAGKKELTYKIPSNAESIGDYAFEGCINLTCVSIPDSVLSLGYSAFKGCSNIIELSIPACIDSVKSTDYPTFEGCTKIKKITLTGNGDWCQYGDSYEYTPWQLSRSVLTEVIIGNNVTSIGAFAFSGCTNISTFTMGDFISKIETSALMDCSSIGSLIVPNGVISIGISAFKGCTGLTELTLPVNIDSVGSDEHPIFEGCTNIQSITMGGGGSWYDYDLSYEYTPWQLSKSNLVSAFITDYVRTIGDYAFTGCTKLSYVYIGTLTNTIGTAAFSGCTSLTSIEVNGNNGEFRSVDNVLFNYNKTTLIQYPIGRSNSSYEIPSGVSTIKEYAFYGCSSINTISIPTSVKYLGTGAFNNCINLNQLSVPATLDCVGSDKSPIFAGCENIKKITFIGSGNWYDYGSTDYEYTPWQLSKSTLAEVIVSDNLSSVGNYALSGCVNLSTITIGNSVSSVGTSAFKGCSALKELTLPACLNSVGSTENPAFEGCTNIKTIIFAGTGEWYSYGTSYDLTPWQYSRSNLATVKINPGVTSIGEGAFRGCTNLSTISIGDSVTTIGKFSLQDCSSLKSIGLPDSLSSIADSAFMGCSSLGSLELTTSVTSIGTSAFKNCTGLKELTLPASLDSVVSPEYPIFEGCTNIETITFTGSGDWYAYNTSYVYVPWQLSKSNLTKVCISDSVRTIGDNAFNGCTELSSVYIGASVTSIGTAAFLDCTSLKSIEVSANNTDFRSVDDVLFNSDMSKLILYSAGNTAPVYDVPNSVESISEYAFSDCISLASITIPKSVTSIGASAFSGCIGLKELTVPVNIDCVGDVEHPIFKGCSNLTKITFLGTGKWYDYGSSNYDLTPWQLSRAQVTTVVISEGVTSIGESAFKDYTCLKDLTVPAGLDCVGSNIKPIFEGCSNIESMTFIGNGAWYGYGSSSSQSSYYGFAPWQLSKSNLTNVSISDGVTSIGGYAFINCTSIKSIAVPDSVTLIGTSAFMGCTALNNIDLSDRLGAIEPQTFSSCTSLVSIQIPDSVISVGDSAFYKCDNLSSVRIGSSVSKIGNSVFKGCSSLSTISVTDNDHFYSKDNVLFDSDTSTLILYPEGKDSSEYTIPNSITSIAEYAFADNQSLKSLLIPNSITSIGNGAFYNCINLNVLTVPGNLNCVGNVDEPVFNGCTNITKITFVGSGKWYDYSSSDHELTPWQLSRSNLIEVIVSDGMTSIGDDAFSGCVKLSTLTIGDSVLSIGASAFKNCSDLKELTIPAGLDCVGFTTQPIFEGCTKIESITFTGTGDWFSYNDSYTYTPWQLSRSYLASITISDGVRTIGDHAFANCTKLTSIYIGASVNLIGTAVFQGCTVLTSIEVSKNNTDLLSEGNVLFNSGKTVLIQYPIGMLDALYEVPSGVTSIREYAFSGCTALTGMVIPDSVTSVGNGAYSGCTALSELTVPVGLDCVVSNTEPVFEYCLNISKITFTGSGAWFHYGTESSQPSYYGYTPWQLSRSILSNVTIADGATSIGESAFKDCTNIHELSLPACLDSVGLTEHPVFEGCVNIEKITYTGSGDWYSYGTAYEGTPSQISRSNLITVIISDSVTSIGDHAFENCTKLSSISIGDSVTSIGISVFRGCSSLTSIVVSVDNAKFCSDADVLFDKGMTLIVQYPIGNTNPTYSIPSTVTSIGANAFYGCIYLKNLTIPESVTSLGTSAFYGCTDLNELSVPVNLDCVGDVEYPIFEGCCNIQKISFTGSGDWHACDASNYEYTPWQLSRFNLNSILISDGVTSIADSTFSDCLNLTEITIPVGLDCVGSKDYPIFEGCCNIQKISFTGSGTWHSYGSLEEYTPWQLSSSVLTTVLISDSVDSLGDQVFKGCTKLSSISIGRSVSSIAPSAFKGCTSLITIDISGDNPYYSSMDGVLFDKNMTSLFLYLEGKTDTSYAIPDTVKTIADHAFGDCTSLITVTIPSSVTYIASSAFDGKFYDSNGETELDQTATNLAGFTFMKIGEKWVKQVPAKTDDGSNVTFVFLLIVAIIAILAVVVVAKKKFA